MLTSYFPMLRKKYNPTSYSEHPLHFAAAEDNADCIQDLIAKGANVYKPLKDGETALHVAIWNRQTTACDMLLKIYERDFSRVEEYLRQKCASLGFDKFWFNKLIAVACTEEECKRAREFESLMSSEHVEPGEVELVLLSRTCDSKHVAIIHVSESNQQQVKHYLESVKQNGYLSWNYCGPKQECETYLQIAAFQGNADLLKRMISAGADPAYPGRKQITPLMEVCSTNNIAIVKMLLEEYSNLIDPTAKDHIGHTALTYILQNGNADTFDYVLKKTITYRKDKFLETDSEAFNKVFRYEHSSWPELSIWSMTDEKSRESFLEPYLKHYAYDLSFCSGYQVMLMEVIIRHTAKSYYQEEIRRKPELLELTDPEGCNVLHCLLWSDELNFVRELYASRPDHCRTLFECDGAVICLASVITHGNCPVLLFILERHYEFVETIADQMMDNFFEEDLLPEGMFDEPIDILVEHLPQLEERVEELKNKIMEEEMQMMMEEDCYYQD
ncbi:ankyrin repeat and death domain-containing protein 1B-like [Topomyia yanbarensis]|uniref:ankyrin repeat and death domain-containing protein 1B-like n=1 Tax=Topomyia yanbarensis TaxID=2498891 RepID=UPI00273C2DA5|nr:ankyrin repeat and death domain-containing protein 1B-like [Topomyia yanbarensis]